MSEDSGERNTPHARHLSAWTKQGVEQLLGELHELAERLDRLAYEACELRLERVRGRLMATAEIVDGTIGELSNVLRAPVGPPPPGKPW
jgi:hypothetical protein